MAHTYVFPAPAPILRRPHRAKRTVASKFDEIAQRSPKDIAAFNELADLVLARLNDEDRRKPH